MSKVYILITLILISMVGFTQAQQKTTLNNPIDTIPFVLTGYNNIALEALLNRQDTVRMMLHTAVNGMYLTSATTARIKKLELSGATDTVSSWGTSKNVARHGTIAGLQIGKLTWQNIPFTEDQNSGQETDGKIGLDLFENKVVSINFDKKFIVITDELPGNIDTYQKIELTSDNGLLFIDVTLSVEDSTLHNPFLLHSGYAGDLLIDDFFANAHKIGDKLKIIGEKNLQDSYGNTIKTRTAILPSISISNQTLKDVPVGFFEGAIGNQPISVVGGDILKRFNIIFDARRKYIYIKPNSFHSARMGKY